MNKEKKQSRYIQAQERRDELLQAAKHLFARNGYHATTTRSINSAIGMADGLLYHYFPDGKMQILETLFQEELERKRTNLVGRLRAISESSDLEVLLYEIGSTILKGATRDRELLIIVLREYATVRDRFSASIHEFFSSIAGVRTMVEPFLQNGTLRKLDPDMMVIQFLSPLTAYIVTSLTSEEGQVVFGTGEDTFLRRHVAHTVSTWQV